LYINIFGEEPWNEWYKCNDCWKLFWLSDTIKNDIKQCLCGSKLQKFYDENQVDKNRLERSNRQWYVCKLAQTLDSKFIGFIMWRETNIEDLNIDKLELDQKQLDMLIKNINDNFEDFNLREFFYGAELWVEKDFRWQGIGSLLYKERIKELINKKKKYILIRTTKKTNKPYKWYQKEWFVDVFEYKDQQERVIMIKNIL
jgi:GNAT superfamily N-acetyltransferase